MKETLLFNSPFEAGVRSIVILNAIYPAKCDLSNLVWLDHFVVHTEDLGGPESLHLDIPQCSGELIVRRQIIVNGIEIMQRFKCLEIVAEESGILYRSTDEAFSLVGLLRTDYFKKLKIRADWINENIFVSKKINLEEVVREKIGRWNIEFEDSVKPGERIL